jgi:hypothetical protein
VQNIAKAISRDRSPDYVGAPERHEQIRRLSAALKVAEKWMETADEDTSVLYNEAECMRENIEEELSRVCFERDVAHRQRTFKAMGGDEVRPYSLEETREDAICDALVQAYCILRDTPEDLFPPAKPLARHELMGALMVALDGHEAKAEAVEGGEPEGSRA